MLTFPPVCGELTLNPVGAPPLGPGIVCVASAAIPLDNTIMFVPLRGVMLLPNLLRMLLAVWSTSGVPSAFMISAEMRPQVLSLGVAGASVVVRQISIALA